MDSRYIIELTREEPKHWGLYQPSCTRLFSHFRWAQSLPAALVTAQFSEVGLCMWLVHLTEKGLSTELRCCLMSRISRLCMGAVAVGELESHCSEIASYLSCSYCIQNPVSLAGKASIVNSSRVATFTSHL